MSGAQGAAAHYDHVTEAWGYLLGEELHYGVFEGDEDLEVAARRLTDLMASALGPMPGQRLLDVGCGTGTPALVLAGRHDLEVVGISTSGVGVERAQRRAARAGRAGNCRFEVRDAMDNRFDDGCFDLVMALESSHLMRDRSRFVHECARVLRPGGRFAMCDIVLRHPLTIPEIRDLLEPLAVLRAVFGDARMEPVQEYEAMCAAAGLRVARIEDLTDATRPTFDRWEQNAHRHRSEVESLLGVDAWDSFVQACSILRRFWDDDVLGYALVAADRIST